MRHVEAVFHGRICPHNLADALRLPAGDCACSSGSLLLLLGQGWQWFMMGVLKHSCSLSPLSSCLSTEMDLTGPIT